MPIYDYEVDGGNCARCSGRFEHLQSLGDAPLTTCPECARPCHRLLSAPKIGSTTAQTLAPSNLARHGFSQYRKVGKGRYEKTAGAGPDTLES